MTSMDTGVIGAVFLFACMTACGDQGEETTKDIPKTNISINLSFDSSNDPESPAEVYLNGLLVTSGQARGKLIAPVFVGRHELGVQIEGYEDIEREVEIVGIGLQEFLFKMKKKDSGGN